MSEERLPIKEFPAGETVIREGRFGSEMFILLKGKVEVSVEGISVAVINTKGSFLGEICALLGTRRIATVKTLEASKFYVIEDLSDYFAKNPESGFLMAKTLASRLIDMNHNFIELKKSLIDLAKNNVNQKHGDAIQKVITTIQSSLVNDVMSEPR
jgi:CRP-like cAMP-binding protein